MTARDAAINTGTNRWYGRLLLPEHTTVNRIQEPIHCAMIENGWFNETAPMWPGQRFSLALDGLSEDSILFHKSSKFQDILLFNSAAFGKVFVIDGIVQLTERDEFAFHEMMAHLPLFSHRNPERILIVGGGDGGVLREVCKHSQVKEITIVEIDEMVVQVSKEHLQLAPPELFDDPRVNIIHADAAKFLQDPGQSGRYDIVIADTLDPLGPAESLFEPEFYEAMHTALKSDGIICTQAESLWIHFELIKDLVGCCANIFQYCEYATTNVPSYPCGQIGFVLARKGESRSCRYPVRKLSFQKDLKFYSPQMHQAAFALPRYVEDELKPLNQHNQSYQEDNLLDDDESEEKCFLHACQIQ